MVKSGPHSHRPRRTSRSPQRPRQAAVASLVAYHALRSGDIRNLRLSDVRDRRLHIGRRVPLAEPVRRRIRAWLDHRARRWPASTNPYLFIHFRTAGRDGPVGPVGSRWVFLTLGLRGGAQAVRADRILQEAIATEGDPRRLVDMFGLSIQHAARYTDAIAEPNPDPDERRVKRT